MYDTAMLSSYKKKESYEKNSLKHENVGLKALFCKIINKIWRRIIFDCKSRILYNFWHHNAMIIFTFEYTFELVLNSYNFYLIYQFVIVAS